MVQKRRSDDWYRKYFDFGIIAAVLGVIVGGSMWVQAQNTDTASCMKGIQTNKDQIVLLKKSSAQIKEALVKNTGTLDNIAKSVDDMSERQEKSTREATEKQEKMMDLIIELLRNKNGNHP